MSACILTDDARIRHVRTETFNKQYILPLTRKVVSFSLSVRRTKYVAFHFLLFLAVNPIFH